MFFAPALRYFQYHASRTARSSAKIIPITMPAMAPEDNELREVLLGCWNGEGPLVDKPLPFTVEVGEESLMQELSSESPTYLRSEEPPERPCESIIAKVIDVPSETSAIQLYEVGPAGGRSTKGSPRGIIPCKVLAIASGEKKVKLTLTNIVTGCTAPV